MMALPNNALIRCQERRFKHTSCFDIYRVLTSILLTVHYDLKRSVGINDTLSVSNPNHIAILFR